jgi:hypothetical protein
MSIDLTFSDFLEQNFNLADDIKWEKDTQNYVQRYLNGIKLYFKISVKLRLSTVLFHGVDKCVFHKVDSETENSGLGERCWLYWTITTKNKFKITCYIKWMLVCTMMYITKYVMYI